MSITVHGIILVCMIITSLAMWFFMYTTWRLDRDVKDLCDKNSVLWRERDEARELGLHWQAEAENLEEDLAELREHMAKLKKRYPKSPWIYELTTAALLQEEEKDE